MFDVYELEATVERFMQERHVPGLSLGVFNESELIYARGFGVTSVETPTPVTPVTLFSIGCVAKTLTGTLVCLLADSGAVNLEYPVDEYIPGFSVRGKEDSGGLTLRHLLSHHSGLGLGVLSYKKANRNPDGLEKHVLHDVPRYPLVADPGTLYSYSNFGVATAGYVAQRVTNIPFPTLVREALLEPLGMTMTMYDPMDAMTYPIAQRHLLRHDGRLIVEHRGGECTACYPTSQCFSNVSDLARFGMLHLRGGQGPGSRLLGSETVEGMHRPQVDLHLDIDLSYGLTFYVGPAFNGDRRIFHEGFFRGVWCRLTLVPRSGVGVVWCDNRGPEISDARYEIIESILAEMGSGPASWERPIDPSVGSREPKLAGLIGRYLPRVGGEEVAIDVRGNTLQLCYGSGRLALSPISETIFVADAPEHGAFDAPWERYTGSDRVSVGFLLDDNNSATHLLLNAMPYKRTD